MVDWTWTDNERPCWVVIQSGAEVDAESDLVKQCENCASF